MNIEIIDNPVAWQQEHDQGPSLNLRGSARFWKTVEYLLQRKVVYRDGAPELCRLVIEIAPGVGLLLESGHVYHSDFEENGRNSSLQPFLTYRFVQVNTGATSEDIEARTMEQITAMFENLNTTDPTFRQ